MKSLFFAPAFLLAGSLSASAFSLDFTGLDLQNPVTLSGADGDQLVISVPGFGNVAFGVVEKGVTAEVTEDFGVPALEFDSSKTISINFFAGSDVENVMVSFVGEDKGEEPRYSSLDGQSGVVRLLNGEAGIQSITFDRVGPKIPEPSTAVLGLLGAVALLRRRR